MLRASQNQSGRVARFSRCGAIVVVETRRPIAPCCTNSRARALAGDWKRSPNTTAKNRPVSAAAASTAARSARVVIPGLSANTSLPRRIASIASAARSLGIAAVTINVIVGSSISRSRSATSGTWGKRLRKPSSTCGLVVTFHQPAQSMPASIRYWVRS